MAALLRFAGGLHIVSGRVVVEAELDTGAVARRLRREIAEVYGYPSEIHVLASGGLRKEYSQYGLNSPEDVTEIHLHDEIPVGALCLVDPDPGGEERVATNDGDQSIQTPQCVDGACN